MTNPDGLNKLTRFVAATQDEVLDAQPLPALKAQLPERRAPLKVRWLVFPAVTALASVALVLALRPAPVLTVAAGTQPPVTQTTWLSVAPGNETPLRFSDGSTVLLTEATRARVASTTARGAVVQVERGSAVVSVVHRPDTAWSVEAGPFQVHVIGTRFTVGWDPAAQAFTLDLIEGSVQVSGPDLEPNTPLVAGQSMRRRLSVEPTPPAPTPPAPTPVDDAPVEVEATVAPAPVIDAGPGQPKPAAQKPDWKALSASGKAREAVSAVNLERTLAGSSAADLLLLADTARLAQDLALSRRVLEVLRQRFPRSEASAEAAFVRGRIEADAERRPDQAVPWFRLALDEAPSGPLAREAMGRLLECLERTHERDEARRVAETYMNQFPTGPHAALARRLLAR